MPNNSFRKVALITGASSSIGEAIVRRLAKENYHLVICTRRQERLDRVTEKLQEKNGHFQKTIAKINSQYYHLINKLEEVNNS